MPAKASDLALIRLDANLRIIIHCLTTRKCFLLVSNVRSCDVTGTKRSRKRRTVDVNDVVERFSYVTCWRHRRVVRVACVCSQFLQVDIWQAEAQTIKTMNKLGHLLTRPAICFEKWGVKSRSISPRIKISSAQNIPLNENFDTPLFKTNLSILTITRGFSRRSRC